MIQKNAPGPIGTSCLTCKQKHRKCDMRQPICLRCEEGGLECLGYSHNRRGVVSLAPSRVLKPRPIMPKPKGQGSGNSSLAHPRTISLGSKSGGEGSCSKSSPPSELGVHLEETGSFQSLSSGSSLSAALYCLDPGTSFQQQDRSAQSLTTRDYLRLFAPKPYARRTTTVPLLLDRLAHIFSRLPPSPSDPTMAYLNGPQFEMHVSFLFNRIMEHAYFKPMKQHSEQLHGMIVLRIRNSYSGRWFMLLWAKICETIVNRDQSQTELHMRWMSDLEVAVRTRLAQDPTPREAEYLRGDWLGVSLLKSAFGRNASAYQAMRSATPAFLQEAYSLPSLWLNTTDPTLIPLRKIIGSGHQALSSFTLTDSSCALIFGLPQQVEYDTSSGPLPKEFLSHEWAHGTPAEFQILLADINACRDQRPGARDWRELEYALVHWEAQRTQNDGTWESWMMVAWLAVQESWRLTLLSYLYFAVCGSSSDDPRIQGCVTQVLQVVGTVKKQEPTDIDIPFFIQYLMAGICAQSERHRKLIRSKLSDEMMYAADFIPVLDHLWHGAGSGGCPITWGDYVYSRETLLPVLL